MRASIFLGLLMIACAINKDIFIRVSDPLILFFILFLLMDAIELWKKIFK